MRSSNQEQQQEIEVSSQPSPTYARNASLSWSRAHGSACETPQTGTFYQITQLKSAPQRLQVEFKTNPKRLPDFYL